MLPLILTILGGYFICDAIESKSFENGGTVEDVGLSKTVEQAKPIVEKYRKTLDEFEVEYPDKVFEINWGSKKRGQGRRIGSGMVVGSMSDAPVGIKKYHSIDLQEFSNDWDGQVFKLLNGYQLTRYYKARKFGMNQIEARYYALKTE